MKNILLVPCMLLSATLFLPACEKAQEVKAVGESAIEAVGELDMGAVSTMVSDLSAKLGDIKDLPSAESISAKVGPMLEKLAEAKDALAGKLETQGLSEAIGSLKSRFSDKEEILKVLEPLMERLSSIVK